MNYTNLLLRHNLCPLASETSLSEEQGPANIAQVVTVLMNLSYYGYALSESALRHVQALDGDTLGKWWVTVEQELKALSGEDRKIGDFVVYKNFPQEVLNMSEGEYWFNQIMIYWGLRNCASVSNPEPRPGLQEQPACKVLQLQQPSSLQKILTSLLSSPVQWLPTEFQDIQSLLQDRSLVIDLQKCLFKENLITLASRCMTVLAQSNLSSTDILRLAAALSNGDISFKKSFKFRSFKRSERRFFLACLERSSNLLEDVSRRPELWKRFLHTLHPGDYAQQFSKVWEVNNRLFQGDTETFNSQVEKYLSARDPQVLTLLQSRPGEFRRRLVNCLEIFGEQAAEKFSSPGVLSKLTNLQLVSLQRYLITRSNRNSRIFPPKGNWSKAQVVVASDLKCSFKSRDLIISSINTSLRQRLRPLAYLDPKVDQIKLPTAGGEMTQYTRGTIIDIPKNITFARTASYWKVGRGQTIWFDNGWNFFNEFWQPAGTCAWNYVNLHNKAAVFSGDPVSSQLGGYAAQMIDLYFDKLLKNGVRYAVWNILCYSHMPFSKAEEVFAALQWGEQPLAGKLFEPSRCQIFMPLTGDGMTKYVCYLDLQERKMVILDISLKGAVHSACQNEAALSTLMPAVVEHLQSLPSVYDLFHNAAPTVENALAKDGQGAYVLYTDQDVTLEGQSAFVFRPENKTNKYETLDINQILSGC